MTNAKGYALDYQSIKETSPQQKLTSQHKDERHCKITRADIVQNLQLNLCFARKWVSSIMTDFRLGLPGVLALLSVTSTIGRAPSITLPSLSNVNYRDKIKHDYNLLRTL